MKSIVRGFESQISEQLTLKVANTDEEGEELAKFNAEVHGHETYDMVKRLYFEHPNKDEVMWFYLRDTSSNEILSALTLMPMVWSVSTHTFKVAEMGYVGTKEDHRGRGFFGILNGAYESVLEEQEYVLSVLVGIPYFYRKFEYEFSLDRLTGYTMPTASIQGETIEEVKVRKAAIDDLPIIKKLYDQTNEKYGISTEFDFDKFGYRFLTDTADIDKAITYIVEEDKRAQGFFTIGGINDADRADILISSELTYLQMEKVLQFVKNYNIGNITGFRVNVHKSSSFGRFLEAKGADPVSDWTWQVKIPDLLMFLEKFKPILEERLAHSPFKRLNRELTISNYSRTITMLFENGEIQSVNANVEFPPSSVDLRIPPPYSAKLYMSDRTIDEIRHIITDCVVKPKAKLLISTLFPKLPSLPISYYH